MNFIIGETTLWLCGPSNHTNPEKEDPAAMENFQTKYMKDDKYQKFSNQRGEVT